MFKYLLSCLCMMNAAVFAQESIEQEGVLASKVLIKDASGFYALSDGSIWKVMGLTPRWRTVSEWWNSIQIVPEDFECAINDFYIGAKLKIVPKHAYDAFDDQCASNKEELARCSHIIINTDTNKCVFAVALRPETALVEVYNESYKQGYSTGYNKGRLSTNIEAYNQYEKGYQAGYQNGVKDAVSRRNNPTP
jgi:hypothetical protein